MDFFHLRELIRNSNNDEADSSNELRNLIAQQTVVQMQENSFKNLKEEFAFLR